jgi:hypothetical protein
MRLTIKNLRILRKKSFSIVYVILAAILIVSAFHFPGQDVHAQTDTFTTSGTWTVPSGVTSAVFEAWGGGGSGAGSSVGSNGQDGGAGGQYAKRTLSSLVASDNYSVTVALSITGTTGNGSLGGDSYVADPSFTKIVVAKGGPGGTSAGGGSGSTFGGIGDVVYAGGSGSVGSTTLSGGGGGGAGSTGNGGNAGLSLFSDPGTGTSLNGGDGGTGLSANGDGNSGNNYGAGGSGAFRSNGPSRVGGTGAQGLVTVTYTPAANSAPNAPTLSSPASGSTVTSTTPNLVMSATDPDNDTIKYKAIIYNSTATSGGNCTGTTFATADQTASGVGWDNGTTAYTSGASATYAVQSSLTRGSGYCWQAQAIDPSGSNTFGSLSGASTFTVNSLPATPTLITPAASATGISLTPQFTLRTTDANGDYLQYRIYLYQSDCTTAVGTSPFNQNSSQTGWSGQDANTNTAYVGSSTLTSSTIATYTYQGTLSASTTYCWKADAIDSGGSNTFSSISAAQTFTTTTGITSGVNIKGGVNIRGGTNIISH